MRHPVLETATVRFKVPFRQPRRHISKAIAPEAPLCSESPRADTNGCPRPRRLVSPVAQLLAIAHHAERLVGAGALKDYAEAAKAMGLRQARMQQILRLLVLAPDLQEGLLDGTLILSERRLQPALGVLDWDQQRSLLTDPQT